MDSSRNRTKKGKIFRTKLSEVEVLACSLLEGTSTVHSSASCRQCPMAFPWYYIIENDFTELLLLLKNNVEVYVLKSINKSPLSCIIVNNLL